VLGILRDPDAAQQYRGLSNDGNTHFPGVHRCTAPDKKSNQEQYSRKQQDGEYQHVHFLHALSAPWADKAQPLTFIELDGG